jgi:hypothetical protein
MTKATDKYPIVNDYLKKLRLVKRSKSADTRRKARREANELLSVMTAKAAQLAMELAAQEGL